MPEFLYCFNTLQEAGTYKKHEMQEFTWMLWQKIDKREMQSKKRVLLEQLPIRLSNPPNIGNTAGTQIIVAS